MFALTTAFTALFIVFSLSLSSPVPHLDPTQIIIEDWPEGCWCAERDITLKDEYICGDKLFGPVNLPQISIVSDLLINYHHFGGLEPCEFWDEYFDREKFEETGSRRWRNPQPNGWALNNEGQAINKYVTLEVGTLLDRFGDENGRYLSLAGEPLAYRSLPPNSLVDTNHFRYKVIQPITLLAGQARPFYEQRGFGTQYFTGEYPNGEKRTVGSLVPDFLERQPLTEAWFPELAWVDDEPQIRGVSDL